MLNLKLLGLTLALAATQCGIAQGADQPLTFVDAHSHLLPNLTIDEEMAMFKRAGVTSVVIMSVPAKTHQELLTNHAGFVIPFASFARSRTSTLAPLNDETIASFSKQLDVGTICGFGEIGTMMDPPETKAASLLNPYYQKVYELAAKHRAPLTYHVEMDSPETIQAFERAADLYPRMPLIAAHAGMNAGPEVAAQLLKHPNIYIELSIRLDPLNGFDGTSTSNPNPRTMLDANGALTPEWRKLLENHPDRFIFGMDIAPTGPKNRELRAVELAEIARKALSVLPRKSQEAIAHGNFEKLVQACPAGPKAKQN